MSKFRNVDIKGSGNQVGDNNTQNNKTVTNNYNLSNKNTDVGEVIAIVAGALGVVATIVWAFFTHIDQVYLYLKIAAITSPILALFSGLIFFLYGYLEEVDILNILSSAVIGAILFVLSDFTRQNISHEVIQLALHNDMFGFWGDLSDYGTKNVIANFISALFLTASILFAHLISIRQFAESMANSSRLGFCYSIYRRTDFFTVNKAGIWVLVFIGIIFFAMNWDKFL